MEYRLADFIYRLEQMGLGLLNMQSEEAIEAINECLSRNMMLKKLFLEKKESDSILDVIK